MQNFTLTELKSLMQGILDEPVPLDGDILDVPFADLGYDSLAKLELASRIKLGHGVHLPDDALADLSTPRALLAYIDRRRSSA